MERNWRRELKEILKKNNMSEEYIEDTVEYTDDERMDEPIISAIGKMLVEKEVDSDIPSCWSNLKNNEYAPAYPTEIGRAHV